MRKDKVLVIAAMDEEVMALRKRMDNVLEKEYYGLHYLEGNLGEHMVFLARSGVGKVNAAMTSSLMIALLNPHYVLNIGSAGGLQKGQAIGDVVVSNKLLYHDFDIGENTYDDDRFQFQASFDLHQKACTILEELGITYHEGLLVAGDQFVTAKESASILKRFPKAQAVDMESAAIAAVCRQMGQSFLVLRSISDISLHEDNDMTFDEYLPFASEQSARICEMMIKKGVR